MRLIEICGKGADAVRAFAAATPLAACDEDGKRLVAILASDPDWPNAAPQPGAQSAFILKVAGAFHESIYCLPAAVGYRALRIVALSPCLTLEIETDRGIVATDEQQLGRHLSPGSARTEAQRQAGFAALSGDCARPRSRPPRQPLPSRLLGRIAPEAFSSWTTSLALPYFDDRLIPVTLGERDPLEILTPGDVDVLDAVLENFLSLGPHGRAQAGVDVLAYCRRTLEAVGADSDEARRMLAITQPADIWAHVQHERIHLLKDTRHGDPSIYVFVLCSCAWEEEHGLQLVYRDGRELLRVGGQDLNVL